MTQPTTVIVPSPAPITGVGAGHIHRTTPNKIQSLKQVKTR